VASRTPLVALGMGMGIFGYAIVYHAFNSDPNHSDVWGAAGTQIGFLDSLIPGQVPTFSKSVGTLDTPGLAVHSAKGHGDKGTQRGGGREGGHRPPHGRQHAGRNH
jgi:hypothetical protein